MRYRFGPEDEDAFLAARDDLLESYRAATEDRDDAPDGFVAAVMLDFKWNYGDGRICDWRRTDVEELLLSHFPRKITLDEEDFLRVAPDVADFLAYLDGRGLHTGDPLPDLRATANALVPGFVDAMGDPSRFGMAKRMVTQMRADGVDTTEQSAIEEWLEGFNARDIEERDDILAGPEVESVALPPIELLPTAELERVAAAASPLLDRLTAFARYVGKGRKLTQQGFLTLADGRALVGSLGTGDRLDDRVGDRVFRTRSTAELPVLDLTFRWARAAGFVKVQHGRVSITRQGSALGAKPLEDWRAAFEGLLKLESVGSRPARGYYGPFAADEIAWLTERLPQWLYERPAFEVERLKEAIWRAIEAAYYVSPEPMIRDSQRRMVGYDVDRVLKRFMELGAVTVTEGTMSLTPLGLWATNRWLRARGEVAPVIGEHVGSSAPVLLAACAEMPLEIAEQEMCTWIGARPDTAARELADAARSGPLPMMALHALGLAGESAQAEVRAMLDIAGLRPQAQVWLVQHGFESPASLPPEAMQYVFLEALAARIDGDGPAAAVAHFGTLGPEAEQISFIEGLLRAEHPRASEILGILGRYHPSKAVAKAARKTAFRRGAIHPA